MSLWTGRIATIAGVVIPLLVFLLRGRVPVERTWKESLPTAASQIAKFSGREAVMFPALLVLLLLNVWLAYGVLVYHPPFPLPPSGVVLKSDGSEIFIADERLGQVRRFDAATVKNELTPIDVGGHPNRMLIGPRSGNLYVLDSDGPKITIVDSKKLTVLHELVYGGHRSNSIAITPDERKLYISNEQPSPQATITVVDLTQLSKTPRSIPGFNCPEGLAILPDGSKLYVSTQCGAGLDPIFVIDTKADRIKKTLRDFAVGTADLAVAKSGQRVYARRDHFTARDKTGNFADVPSEVAVVDTSTDEKVESEAVHSPSSAFTVSPDGKYLFFANGADIEIVNTDTQATSSFLVGAPVAAIGVGHAKTGDTGLVCYAWIPELNRIFFTGLTGLLP